MGGCCPPAPPRGGDCWGFLLALPRSATHGRAAASDSAEERAEASPARARWPPLEQAVAEVWEHVFAAPGAATLGAGFAELGGESLLALRACASLQYLLGGGGAQPREPDDGLEFGELSGAFAVAPLLAAPSLAVYCAHLRRHGHGAPSLPAAPASAALAPAPASAGGTPANGEVQARRPTAVGATAGAAADAAGVGALWPAVRAAARSTAPGAAARLVALLDSAPPEVAAAWCGALRRGAGSGSRPQFTALHAASQAGAAECLQALLERRARATAVEAGAAMTPAHYAAMASPECLRLLLDAKAPLTVRDRRGQSLIHAAARAGCVASIRLLLEVADRERSSGLRALRPGEGTWGLLEWTDRWARSAVHWAALNGHLEALAALLEFRADAAPRLIATGQMAKRTHLAQEQPLALALRVHGPDSEVAQLLSQALYGPAVDAAAHACAGSTRELHSAGAEAKGQAPPPPEYLLTLGSEAGLDRLAFWELRERLAATAVRRVRCRIFFSSDASPPDFSVIKSAEKLCAVVLHAVPEDVDKHARVAADVDHGTPEVALAQWIAGAKCWGPTVRVWWRFHGDLAGTPEEAQAAPLTFKVTCRRSGRRFAQLSSQALALAVASALVARRGWRAQVRRPDLEVRVLVSDVDLLVDVPLLVQGAIPIGGGELCSAGLNAPVAWALARSAELRPGERVLDPMCGKAVVLIEASLNWPRCEYLGLDVDEEQLRGARSNALLSFGLGLGPGARGRAPVELLRGDGRRLPLPAGSVDALLCDVPFGRQYGTMEGCRGGLYAALLGDFDRVVSQGPSGRMVLLASLEQEPWLLGAAGFSAAAAGDGGAARAPPGRWVCRARRELRLGALDAVIVVLRRPGAGEEAAGCALPVLSKRLWWETDAGRGDWSSLKVAERPPMQPARGRGI